MLKQKAIELLGGTVSAAAEAIGISYQAVDKWPDVLPPRIADRVQAAMWRMSKTSTTPAEQQAPAGAVHEGTEAAK